MDSVIEPAVLVAKGLLKTGEIALLSTVLLRAVIANDEDIVTKLYTYSKEQLGYTNDVDFSWLHEGNHFRNHTPLMKSAEHGHVNIIRKILELGGELYSPLIPYTEDIYNQSFTFVSKDYFDALIIAASKGHIDCIEVLIEYRLFEVAKVQDKYGDFLKAAKDGDFQKMGSLLELMKNKDVFLKGWRGHNIMNFCLLLGCPSSCLQTMLDHGVEVNGWDYNGLTPIMCAILGKNAECLKLLLDKGGDPYEVHIIRRIAFQDDGTVLKYIDIFGVGMDIKLDSTDDWEDMFQGDVGYTALMYAAAIGHLPILEMMLKAAPKDIADHGRCVRNPLSSSLNPLTFAVFYGTVEAASMILDYEAATSSKEPNEDLLGIAISNDKTEMFDLLLDTLVVGKGWPFHCSLKECVLESKSKYVNKMLEKVHRNIFECDDGAALFMAIATGEVEYVVSFVKRPEFQIGMECCSGDFDIQNKVPVFMYACQKGQHELAQMFMEMGADVNATDCDGKTAVMYAARHDKVEILDFLLEVGAAFDVVDKNGGTVFSAALMGNGTGLEFLLNKGALLDKDGLKPIHRESVKVFSIYGRFTNPFDQQIPIHNVILLIRINIFDWNWCVDAGKFSIRNIIFAAISSGLLPGKILYKNRSVTPFMYGVLTNHVPLVRYLLANHCFSSEDYRFLLANSEVENILKFDNSSDMAFLIEQVTLRPLSLTAWNTMSISGSIAHSNNAAAVGPIKMRDQVDQLPLPSRLKDILKTNKTFSQVCPCHWSRLGPHKGDNSYAGFDDLVLDGDILDNVVLEACPQFCFSCKGVALTTSLIPHGDMNDDNVVNVAYNDNDFSSSSSASLTSVGDQ